MNLNDAVPPIIMATEIGWLFQYILLSQYILSESFYKHMCLSMRITKGEYKYRNLIGTAVTVYDVWTLSHLILTFYMTVMFSMESTLSKLNIIVYAIIHVLTMVERINAKANVYKIRPQRKEKKTESKFGTIAPNSMDLFDEYYLYNKEHVL